MTRAFGDPVAERVASLAFAGALGPSQLHVYMGEAQDDGEAAWVRIWIEVDPAGPVVKTARFQAFGCAQTIACASVLAELAEGRDVEAAGRIEAQKVASSLSLSDKKSYACVLAQVALTRAIAQWEQNRDGRNER